MTAERAWYVSKYATVRYIIANRASVIVIALRILSDELVAMWKDFVAYQLPALRRNVRVEIFIRQ